MMIFIRYFTMCFNIMFGVLSYVLILFDIIYIHYLVLRGGSFISIRGDNLYFKIVEGLLFMP